MEAKKAELKKLTDFKSYEVVPDRGQNSLSTRWVLWNKDEQVRARLTVRGFEEEEDLLLSRVIWS